MLDKITHTNRIICGIIRIILQTTMVSSQIKDLSVVLSNSTKVVVPTDKTNSFIIIETDKYIEWVKKHLDKATIFSLTEKIKEIFDSANELLLGMEEVFDQNEYNFIKETIESRAIPTLKLLVKDHKKLDREGNLFTRLVVPAPNFTAAFPKIVYIGIKKVFDKEKINYSRRTIIQASDLKIVLESMTLNNNEVTTISLDIEAMYPLITFKTVKNPSICLPIN